METEGMAGVVANKDIFDKEGSYDPKSATTAKDNLSKTNESLNLR